MTANERRTLSVLLVEDSVHVRHRLVSLFCESPHVRIVGEAGSIDEAVIQLRTTRPEVVVLDVELPDGNGLQLVRALREHSPNCHVMILTTHDLPELRQYCMKLGVQDFFNKAFQFDEAAERLHDLARAKAGSVSFVNACERPVGVFTDGDLRRQMAADDRILSKPLSSVMTRQPICLREDALAVEALKIFNERAIDDLIVVNAKGEPVGLVDSQDLPKLKLM